MVFIKLVSLTEKTAIYDYFPEHERISGRVSLEIENRDRKILKKAQGYGLTYAHHALKRIEEFANEMNFKKEDLIAWY